MDVTDDDIVLDEERRSNAHGLRALASCPTKRVEITHYREAQEEARLAGLSLLAGRRAR
jgi:hypothetical protein